MEKFKGALNWALLCRETLVFHTADVTFSQSVSLHYLKVSETWTAYSVDLFRSTEISLQRHNKLTTEI